MGNKSIIIISDYPQLRGRRYFIADSLAERGYDIHYLMWDSPHHLHGKKFVLHFFTSLFTKQYPYEKVTVHKIARLPYYWPYINGLLFKYQLKRLYRRVGASLIFTESYTNELEVPKSLPFIYDLADDYSASANLYGATPFYKLGFKLLGVKGTMKRQCKNALAVTAISDILYNFAKKYNSNVIKLPSGIDRIPIEEVLKDSSTYPTNNYSLVYVSNFGKWSRSIEAMQAVVELRSEFSSIELNLIGYGVETEIIKDYIKVNAAEQYIHFLGPIFDHKLLFTYINQAAIGLNISVKDEFRDAAHPVKVLEYSAMGKKVVSTNLAEVEALGFPNIFIFSDSVKGRDLKTTLRKALLHTGNAKEYAKVSSHVLKEYDWNKHTDKLIGLIEGVSK